MLPVVFGRRDGAAIEVAPNDVDLDIEVAHAKGTASRAYLLALLCAVCSLEGADAMLLPVCFHALERDLALTPVNLAYMALAQALFQSVAAPVWGIIADRGIATRRTILTMGCVGWGLVTILLAVVNSFSSMIVLRAVNGSLLACLNPVSQGLVADITAEHRRGRILGLLQFSVQAGMAVVALVATPLSTRSILRMQGWRVVFSAVGLCSLLLAVLVGCSMEEPPREGSGEGTSAANGTKEKEASIEKADRSTGKGCGLILSEVKRLSSLFRLPTFTVIVLQGLFGSVPWNALGFGTMYFQKAGFSDEQSASLTFLFLVATAFGGLLGGCVGDGLTHCCPRHGRPLTAQISVSSGIPIVTLIFLVIEPNPEAFIPYVVLMVTLGLTSSWCGAGVNRPILSEIVGPESRSVIIAWDVALEGSAAALLGAPAVGFLAERVFGYSVLPSAGHASLGKLHDGSSQAAMEELANDRNVHALGSALATATSVPWLICLVLFTFMHWSYPRDKDRVSALAAESARAVTVSAGESEMQPFTAQDATFA
mmetsp:Transcript_8005/g.17304  ORF Transcript_8005/g.17304 Transcript_8005/m.17304 type:complete len:540 (-) Transcript_8005:112-1731(-)